MYLAISIRTASVARIFAILVVAVAFTLTTFAQDNPKTPSIVQPGAPGENTSKLSSDMKGTLPPVTEKDREFMRGMIHHHAQAVEMVDLLRTRTKNEELVRFAERIAQTQASEIDFMKRWLEMRSPLKDEKSGKMKHMMDGSMHGDHKEKITMKSNDMPNDHSGHKGHQGHTGDQMLMPGMLTPKEMKALAAAKDDQFDYLFLVGMIKHHEGALVMVDDLFSTPGAGQDSEMFTFASDVDASQRVEIRIMQEMLRIREEKKKGQ